jgi:transketolase
MRDAACNSWVDLAGRHPFVFLTGDLGFKALEPLRDALGERFINAGVAEQNMVSVAAGLASQKHRAWVYSIAPFCYARPYEQIRNDVCLHKLPVRFVGNGGGYGYGPMGATHHALEDYGSLLALTGMQAWIPAFDSDVVSAIAELGEPGKVEAPVYLRLGRDEAPASFARPAFATFRKLADGDRGVLLCVGPLVGPVLAQFETLAAADRPALWLLSKLPVGPDDLPPDLVSEIEASGTLLVAEEHVSTGGAGERIARCILERGLRVPRFELACAQGYPSGSYGSQAWHRRECGLDAQSLLERMTKLLERSPQ